MYIRGNGTGRLIVGVYVDDLIITGGDAEAIDKFKALMMSTFRMSDLGLLSYYLAQSVARSSRDHAPSNCICRQDPREGGDGWQQLQCHAH
jgi:hypothetical protein